MPVQVTSQANGTVIISRGNALTVQVSDTGLKPSGKDPFLLQHEVGTIGGVTDIFALTPPTGADVLVFDQTTSAYKNVPLSGSAVINSTGAVSITTIDGGVF